MIDDAQIEVSRGSSESKRRALLVCKGILITVIGFILTWSPYGIVFFLLSFRGKDNRISPLSTFICACFSKLSVIWISMLYIITSTHFKFYFILIDKQGQTINIPEPIQSISNQQKKRFYTD